MPKNKNVRKSTKSKTTKKQSLFAKFSRFSARSKAVVFVLFFGLIGAALLFQSFATTNTLTYQDNLTSAVPVRSYAISSGGGTLSAQVSNTLAKVRVSIVNQAGTTMSSQVVSRKKTTASTSSQVAAGTYTVKISYDSSVTRDINYKLTVSFPSPDISAPTVSFVAPQAGSTISGGVPVQAAASDDTGIAKVEFYVDSKLTATETQYPYCMAGDSGGPCNNWDSKNVPDGTHTLSAIAYDTSGKSKRVDISVNISNNPTSPTTCPAGTTGTYPNCTTTSPPTTSGSWPNSVSDLGSLTSTGGRINANDYPNRSFSGLSIVDNSGDPTVWDSSYNGYTGSRFYTEGREGPRSSGGPIVLSNCWIQIHAEATDHADGIQAYGGSGISVTSCKILAGGGGATGIFAADNSHGAITLNHVYFGQTPGTINGGYGVRINSDGADSASFNDVVFECGKFDVTVSVSVPVTQWDNVRCTDGTPIPRP